MASAGEKLLRKVGGKIRSATGRTHAPSSSPRPKKRGLSVPVQAFGKKALRSRFGMHTQVEYAKQAQRKFLKLKDVQSRMPDARNRVRSHKATGTRKK